MVDGVTILDLPSKIAWEPDAQSLKDIVNRLVQAGRRHLALNLAEVPSLDSTSLGMIVSAFVTANRQGATLKLVNVSRRNRELFAIVKLAKVFEMHDSEADLIRSFSD